LDEAGPVGDRITDGRLETPTWHDQGVEAELGDDGTEMRAEVERIDAELSAQPEDVLPRHARIVP